MIDTTVIGVLPVTCEEYLRTIYPVYDMCGYGSKPDPGALLFTSQWVDLQMLIPQKLGI